MQKKQRDRHCESLEASSTPKPISTDTGDDSASSDSKLPLFDDLADLDITTDPMILE